MVRCTGFLSKGVMMVVLFQGWLGSPWVLFKLIIDRSTKMLEETPISSPKPTTQTTSPTPPVPQPPCNHHKTKPYHIPNEQGIEQCQAISTRGPSWRLWPLSPWPGSYSCIRGPRSALRGAMR
ncbi:uncharacterized protein P884DRAFT_132975 [Thermothelomyces heterothallicus CBS 202.75]|uniref:uncharacterized protein n=1 Tax=Thermothelomyces heterothallicus CBS 202.75 TaxID=1149848 RepID=UPI0037440ABC